MGLKHYNVSGACNGTVDVPVNDTISNPLCKFLNFIDLLYFRWFLSARILDT